MTLEESKDVSDKVEEVEGLSFLINERDEPYLQGGILIRLVNSPWFGAGLRIEPANSTGYSC